MNVVEFTKIVAWLCDIYFSLLISFGNYDMFLIMQLKLTCISFQRTANNILEEEPKYSRVKDATTKEIYSKEYKENDRSTSRHEDHLGHEK